MKVVLKTVVYISLISVFSLSAMEVQKTSFDDLMQGAKTGNIGLVRKAIENKVDINKQEEDANWTALMTAAYEGNKDIVKLLLEGGAKVNLKNKWGEAALFYAAIKRNLEIAKLLLEYGADVNIGSDDGWTALLFANVFTGNEQMELLRNKGVDIRRKEIVKLFLEYGVDVNAANYQGITALMLASKAGFKEMVELLINNGANIGLKDEEGNTAWMMAKSAGHQELANYIENKAREIQKLMLDATIKGDQSALKELITKHGSTLFVDLIDTQGNTLLHRAIMSKKFKMAIYIISLFPQLLDVKNYGGQTAIMEGLFEQYGDPEFNKFMEKITQTGILRRKGG